MAKLKLHSSNLYQVSPCVHTGVYWQSQLTMCCSDDDISEIWHDETKVHIIDTVCIWYGNIKWWTSSDLAAKMTSFFKSVEILFHSTTFNTSKTAAIAKSSYLNVKNMTKCLNDNCVYKQSTTDHKYSINLRTEVFHHSQNGLNSLPFHPITLQS